MIIEYDKKGRIFHIMRDPVPPGVVQAMEENGATFLNLPPIPLPEEHAIDPDTGEELFEEIVDEETGEKHYEPLMESPGMTYTECELSTHYVVDGELAERPSPSVDFEQDESEIRISGVPAGSAVAIVLEADSELQDTQTFEADGELITIEIDEPGKLRIVIRPPWPLQEVRREIEA
ncbi:hypothetical protein [Chelativorans sp. YIM 93263]|uniref:hypothetical protein n=1 Tax=Chelativorans sp. YIM 93263 TaxID=2906648 RepID=UPI00237891F8|nr:hypothetical protein [Chelativorans sp. YIM 93263]